MWITKLKSYFFLRLGVFLFVFFLVGFLCVCVVVKGRTKETMCEGYLNHFVSSIWTTLFQAKFRVIVVLLKGTTTLKICFVQRVWENNIYIKKITGVATLQDPLWLYISNLCNEFFFRRTRSSHTLQASSAPRLSGSKSCSNRNKISRKQKQKKRKDKASFCTKLRQTLIRQVAYYLTLKEKVQLFTHAAVSAHRRWRMCVDLIKNLLRPQSRLSGLVIKLSALHETEAVWPVNPDQPFNLLRGTV